MNTKLHLYKVTTSDRTFYTTALHLMHLHEKLRKNFGVYKTLKVEFIK